LPNRCILRKNLFTPRVYPRLPFRIPPEGNDGKMRYDEFMVAQLSRDYDDLFAGPA
jgi:hypothetical protein